LIKYPEKYLYQGRVILITDITPMSFSYKDANRKWANYSVSSSGKPFQYENFLTPIEDLTQLERVIYGIQD
jgi:hypothetical protein